MFPWIVDIFDLSPYYFYKVIEIIIRAEEGLSRDVVKYLNHVRLDLFLFNYQIDLLGCEITNCKVKNCGVAW